MPRKFDRLGPYEIKDLIGAGAMGEVYRARDTRLERSVAIKVLPSMFTKDEEQQARLEREARAAGSLNHPNVLTIYDIGNDQGVPYIVAELLEGKSLREILSTGPMLRSIAVSYGAQIASGLSAAHEKSVIHRDLKPENIFVTTSGIVKILDFGLAKIELLFSNGLETQAPTAALTQPGSVLGTFSYMSPEQARGQIVDVRSDLFSFGIVLYEMLAGKRPFRGQTMTDVLTSILRDTPDFSEFDPPLTEELMGILQDCLAKNAADRFETARDVSLALRIIEAEFLAQSNRAGRAPVLQKHADFRIAVLPFQDLSAEQDQQYFCEGMTEELITSLTKVDGLKVLSRTSTFQFQGREIDVRKVGKQLGAGAILHGSVRKSGNRIRITADLIHVQDGYHLWSEKYDREMADVFDIQDEITRTIVDTLKSKLLPQSAPILVPRYTDNKEAYNLYLKGRYHWNKRHQEGLERAIEYFEEAIDHDPAYALAYSGLADCYSILGFYAFRPPVEMVKKARTAAEASLRIDPNLAEGYLSMGAVQLYFDNDWEKGDRSMSRSLELNPLYGLGHCWYSGFLSLMGRYQEARDHAKKAVQIDPLSPLFSYFYGFSLFNERRYDESLQQFHNSFEIDPDFLLAHWCLGLAHLKKNKMDLAIQNFEKVCVMTNRSPYYLSYLGYAYALAGETETSEKLLREMQDRSNQEYVAPLSNSRILMALGRMEEAYQALEKAIAEKNVVIYLFHSPEFDSWRSEQRFQQILKSLMS